MQVNQSIHRAALYSAACDRENRHEHYTDRKNGETEHKVCKLKYSEFALIRIIRELMQQRRRWLRERHLKRVKSRCFKIFRDYSILFNSSIAGNFVFLELDCKDRIEVQEKNKKVVVLCLRSPQNVEFHVVVVQWRQRNVQKSVMQVKSFFFWPI